MKTTEQVEADLKKAIEQEKDVHVELDWIYGLYALCVPIAVYVIYVLCFK